MDFSQTEQLRRKLSKLAVQTYFLFSVFVYSPKICVRLIYDPKSPTGAFVGRCGFPVVRMLPLTFWLSIAEYF